MSGSNNKQFSAQEHRTSQRIISQSGSAIRRLADQRARHDTADVPDVSNGPVAATVGTARSQELARPADSSHTRELRKITLQRDSNHLQADAAG